jgi:hypothetical protein
MNKDRKKFRDTKVGEWLGNNAPDILESVGDAVPGAGLLSVIGDALKGRPDISAEQELEFLRLATEQRTSENEAVSSRWASDMGSRYALPHLVRPIVLLSLTAAIIGFALVDAMDEVPFTMGTRWTETLTTLGASVFVAYFGGRSVEKVWKK